ncbi:MAG: DUF5107 domain-containing protein [Ginsengibacter sp.]
MKRLLITAALTLFSFFISFAQQKATVREYTKTFTTYPFSDPDPIPHMGKIYPYFRFDGYTNKPIQKEWKVVELENDYIKVLILPEIGGKIWAAIEKSTGKSFIYYNHVVKFRDVAMRGPWTSGGIEPNYGIIGHTPNCATPVDYVKLQKPDGSVSCVVGVLDLLTRTSWKIDINLAKDKAYFTTSSFWYNASPFEQPYYTWMNTGIKAGKDLQFIYPGTKYLGHEGEHSDWPVNKENGKDISWYKNNDFGGYKSYHVFGKYTDFFGAYWHDDNFGMGRYSTHDNKPGKKLWIWGLSQQGMIWEKLLTDTDGQYVEVQSGRLFNQAAEGSTFTPFKHTGFTPHSTDVWTEYWFPVVKTNGFVVANNYGALNIVQEDGWLKIYFSPLQHIEDDLKITNGEDVIYSKKLNLETLQLFKDSIKLNNNNDSLVATLGDTKLRYDAAPSANVLSRPVDTPADFDWNSSYGLYLQGKENMRQRDYIGAGEKLKAALQKDSNYLPALVDYAVLLYRNQNYMEALSMVKKALSIDTYDAAANYYYGIINIALGNITDAKDGFDISALGNEYRSAAYTELAKLYFKEKNYEKAKEFAHKSIDFNRYAVEAYQVLAVTNRLQKNQQEAIKILDAILNFDPLNHFALFEKYLNNNSGENKNLFLSGIKNEQPEQTFLETAILYYNIGLIEEADQVLKLAPQNTEVKYWQAYLEKKPIDLQETDAAMIFPFRRETAGILKYLITQNDHWLLKYHLALIEWNNNNLAGAKELFTQLGDKPGYAPFYAARAELFMKEDNKKSLADLTRATQLDQSQWRYARALINYHLSQGDAQNALSIAANYYKLFPANYSIGMLNVKALMLNGEYEKANTLLKVIDILPYEGATESRQLYRETQLMLALENMKKHNYKKALTYINAARKWPQNLGAGKPYDEDIDERLEDWLAYQNDVYLKKDAAAKQMLDHIISFHKKITVTGNYRPSPNNLVTAWALKKVGRPEEAQKYLEQLLIKNPDDVWAQWATHIYNGKSYEVTAAKNSDENFRIINMLLTISGK